MKLYRRQRLYEVTAVFLGFSLVIALTTAVYSHLWLGLSGTDVPTLFTDTVSEEETVMEALRRLGAVGSVVLLALGVVLTRRYVQFVTTPRWEARKTLVAGSFLALTGTLFYLVASNLFVEALYLSLVSLTAFVVVALGLLLLFTEASEETPEHDHEVQPDDSPRCGQCGIDVTEANPYCPRCGSELS